MSDRSSPTLSRETFPPILSRETFSEIIDVSRETLDRLALYVALLTKWQRRINLVGPKTIEDVWRRHILDSAQVYSTLANCSGPVLDLGSGAGFPGLVLSIMGVKNITLLEANQKKCSFLGEVVRQTACSAVVYHGRIEDYPEKKSATFITARALAPLEDLLAWSHPLLAEDGKCLFLKGGSYEQELTQSEKKWTMEVHVQPSLADDNKNTNGTALTGVLLEIGKLSPRNGK